MLNKGKTFVSWSWEKCSLAVFKNRLRKSLQNVYWDSIILHIVTEFVELKINAGVTILKKAFAKCLKSLTVNSLHEGASAFTEHPLKSVALALQNFHEIYCIL